VEKGKLPTTKTRGPASYYGAQAGKRTPEQLKQENKRERQLPKNRKQSGRKTTPH